MAVGAVATMIATITTASSSRAKSVMNRRRPREESRPVLAAASGSARCGGGPGRGWRGATLPPRVRARVRAVAPAVLPHLHPRSRRRAGWWRLWHDGGPRPSPRERPQPAPRAQCRAGRRSPHGPFHVRAVAIAGIQRERDRHRLRELGAGGADERVEHRRLLLLLLERQLGQRGGLVGEASGDQLVGDHPERI